MVENRFKLRRPLLHRISSECSLPNALWNNICFYDHYLGGLTKTGGDIGRQAAGVTLTIALFKQLHLAAADMHTYLCGVSHSLHSLLAAVFYPKSPSPAEFYHFAHQGFSPAQNQNIASVQRQKPCPSRVSLLCLYPTQPRVLPSDYYCSTLLVFLLLPGPCPWTLKSCSFQGFQPLGPYLCRQSSTEVSAFLPVSGHQVKTDQSTVFYSWILALLGFTRPH